MPRAALPYPPLLLSEEAAAAYVGLSVSTIKTLPGFPAATYIGRRKLYREDRLRAWVLTLPDDSDAEAARATEAFG
jgi:hypothetical protein